MQANVLKYLEARVPRYTSYPTAAQFGPQVGAGTYAAWLARLPAHAPVSLYLHVPFCAELCLYCGCNTAVVRNYGPVEAYAALLAREIPMVGAIAGRRKVVHLHWGGGTPTMLSLPDFAALTARLQHEFEFAADAEAAVEIDPRTVSHGHATMLAQLGITRASFGVQDFDERVQRAVGRIQSVAQTERAVEWFRAAGIRAINVDLMYGLPYQTVASIERTIAQVLALAPDRVALFGYAHVPWMKRHQRLIDEAALPGTQERFVQSQAAAAMLTAAGYEPIGLDHFAKPSDALARCRREGRLRRNFQGYTADQAEILIGLGTSAIGMLPQGYVQNAPTTVAYRRALHAGQLATTRGVALTAEDRLRRSIIESLMCNLRVDFAAVCTEHGVSLGHFAAELSRLDALAADGIVVRDGSGIVMADGARSFVRTVCAVFDGYLAAGEIRYSRAS